MAEGKLFVISGASGVGKGTVLKAVMQGHDDFAFSVSATTRAARPGEVEGESYYFVSKEKFEDMIEKGEFLEYDNHAANYYGTPRSQVEEKLARGHVFLDIEPNGARAVKAAAPDAVLIFIMPPDLKELRRRLEGRGDTSPEQIKMRMERATWEMEQSAWYDYTVVNDQVDRCAAEILNIVAQEADK